MRRFGVMPYMTPLQRATESSTVPKSVMKTTVGGYLEAGCSADRRLPRRRSAANPLKSLCTDRRGCGSTKFIDRSTPKKTASLLEIRQSATSAPYDPRNRLEEFEYCIRTGVGNPNGKPRWCLVK